MSKKNASLLQSLLKLAEPIQIYSEHDILESCTNLSASLDDRLRLLDLLLKDFFDQHSSNNYDKTAVLALIVQIDQILVAQSELLITTIDHKIVDMLTNLCKPPKI